VPGTVTLVVPYLLLSSRANSFDFEFSYLRLLGLLPIVAGVLLYIWCAWDFTFTGKGTPAPFDPPKELVVKGSLPLRTKPDVYLRGSGAGGRGDHF
jgi:hypothetical protein